MGYWKLGYVSREETDRFKYKLVGYPVTCLSTPIVYHIYTKKYTPLRKKFLFLSIFQSIANLVQFKSLLNHVANPCSYKV